MNTYGVSAQERFTYSGRFMVTAVQVALLLHADIFSLPAVCRTWVWVEAVEAHAGRHFAKGSFSWATLMQ